MAGFRKAKAEQAALKMGMFGPAGSGKTFTSLLIAEGIVRHEGKGRKIAYWDTEHGTDFYAKEVPNRRVHPSAFDFDAIYTRSITEGSKAIHDLDPDEYGIAIIDSMTHIWEATLNAYSGKRDRSGKIPFHAWAGIKKPYKDLMNWMLNTPMHVMLLGRQANEWAQDDDTGESVAAGVKMRAEGETAYEPHLLVRMEGVKPLREDGKTVKKNAEAIPTMYVIKDRTGVLQGKVIEFPNFETVAMPILPLLGGTQAKVQSDDEAAAVDAENLTAAERARRAESDKLKRELIAQFELAKTADEIQRVANSITPEVKKKLANPDLEAVRAAWSNRTKGLPAIAAQEQGQPAE